MQVMKFEGPLSGPGRPEVEEVEVVARAGAKVEDVEPVTRTHIDTARQRDSFAQVRFDRARSAKSRAGMELTISMSRGDDGIFLAV